MNKFIEKYTNQAKQMINTFQRKEIYPSDLEDIYVLRGKILLLSELCENRDTALELLMVSEDLYSLSFLKRFKNAI
jgi:hypothetical protein